MHKFTQGELVDLDIYFHSYRGGPLIDPDGWVTSTEPTVSVIDQNGTTVVHGLASRYSIGHFHYSYQLGIANPIGTLWRFSWAATINGKAIPASQLTEYFEVVPAGYASANSYVNNLRTHLAMEASGSVSLYRLRRRFTDPELEVFLEGALSDWNMESPTTNHTFDTFPSSHSSILMMGGMIWALLTMQVFEAGKHFSYSDGGITINRDRQPKFGSIEVHMAQRYGEHLRRMKYLYGLSTLGVRGQFSSVTRIPRNLQRAMAGVQTPGKLW
jgi:hypothetical protein